MIIKEKWGNYFRMSRWADNFIEQYGETGTVKNLTKEINDATCKKREHDAVEKALSEVIQGKWKRRSK